jgi:hypothetical protein
MIVMDFRYTPLSGHLLSVDRAACGVHERAPSTTTNNHNNTSCSNNGQQQTNQLPRTTH